MPDVPASGGARHSKGTLSQADETPRKLFGQALSGNPVFDESGTFSGYRGTARDVSERYRAEAALREAHGRLEALSRSGLVGIVAGRDAVIEEANDAFLDMLGLDRQALAAGHLDWPALAPAERVLGKGAWPIHAESTGAVNTIETAYLRRDGSRLPALLSGACLDRPARRWFALVQDLTPIKTAEERVRELAGRDGLTGLANRHVFFERLRGDLDNFKEINDKLGHEAGDILLKTIGERLTTVVRGTDTVVRVGGDEFAVILRRLRAPEAMAPPLLGNDRHDFDGGDPLRRRPVASARWRPDRDG